MPPKISFVPAATTYKTKTTLFAAFHHKNMKFTDLTVFS